MKHDFTSRIRIYHVLEVTYDHPSSIQDAVTQSTEEPEIFDYRCEDYTFRKLTETPQCQVVQGPAEEEEEISTCCECGSRMQHVRPGKWQCLTCENLEVWKFAAESMFGFLQGIEQGSVDGLHKVDDDFLVRLQKFLRGYKNLCDPDDVEDESQNY